MVRPKRKVGAVSVTLTYEQIEFLSQKPNVSKYMRKLVSEAISLERREGWANMLVAEIKNMDEDLQSLEARKTRLIRRGISEDEEQQRKTWGAIERVDRRIEAINQKIAEISKLLGVDIKEA